MDDSDDLAGFFSEIAEVESKPAEVEEVAAEDLTASADPIIIEAAAVPALVPVTVPVPVPPASAAASAPAPAPAPDPTPTSAPVSGPSSVSLRAHHLPIASTSSTSSNSTTIAATVTQYQHQHQHQHQLSWQQQPPPPPPPPSRGQTGSVAQRLGAGEKWVDPTLDEWPANDYRLFVGDLSQEVSSEQLSAAFASQFQSFAMARVVRSKHDNKSKGYGFVSFLDPMDCARALREMNGKYCGARPMKITKSTWLDRDVKVAKKKETKKRKIEEALGLR